MPLESAHKTEILPEVGLRGRSEVRLGRVPSPGGSLGIHNSRIREGFQLVDGDCSRWSLPGAGELSLTCTRRHCHPRVCVYRLLCVLKRPHKQNHDPEKLAVVMSSKPILKMLTTSSFLCTCSSGSR